MERLSNFLMVTQLVNVKAEDLTWQLNSDVFAVATVAISCTKSSQLKVEIITTTKIGHSGYFIPTRNL